MFLLVFACCEGNGDLISNIATLSTTEVTGITATTAKSGGNITSNGGAEVTAKGICWDIGKNPDITDNKTQDGTGIGAFVRNLTGLVLGTTYYVRSYATNSAGTAYGNEISFTTSFPRCAIQILPVNVKQYGSVRIGSQCWMNENLVVSKYKNGDPIPQVTDPTEWSTTTTGAWCYYNNDPANEAVYGKLYNWFAVNDPRGLAPEGWHIPSDAEWDTLISFLGGENVAGGKMKEVGTEHWSIPNLEADNSSGFMALPGGQRVFGGGVFLYIDESGSWWSSTEESPSAAYIRYLSYNDGVAPKDFGGKRYGFSVRCIFD